MIGEEVMKCRNYIYCVGMMSGGSQSTPHAASGSRMAPHGPTDRPRERREVNQQLDMHIGEAETGLTGSRAGL